MISPLKKIALSASMLIFAAASAQENAPVEMATGLYQSGKIYVVVVVMSLIFLGIAGYLVMLDRKISKLEKDNK